MAIRLKHIAIGCGGIVVVVVAVVAVVLFLVTRLTAEPERVAREFVDRAAAGDYAAAHDYFSVPLKESQPLEVFEAAVRANPSLFAVQDLSFNERGIDTSGATLSGTATLAAGTEVPVSFHLVQENDAWKLLSYSIGSSQ